MCDYGDYDGDTIHDMWVDYTYHENTGELSDWYGDGAYEHYWVAGRKPYQPKMSTADLIETCRRRIANYESRIEGFKADIEQATLSLENKKTHPKEIPSLQHLLKHSNNRICKYQTALEEEQQKLILLLIKREKERNLWIVGFCLFAILLSLIIFWIFYRH